MTNLLTFLNQNQGAFIVVFSALVALATIAYAVLTAVLVAETRRMRRAQADPLVAVRLEAEQRSINFIDLVVRNDSGAPAAAVQFVVTTADGATCHPELLDAVARLGFIRQGLGFMGPRQEFRSFLTSMVQDLEGKLHSRINCTVRYRSPTGEPLAHSYLLDFSIFENLLRVGTTPESTICEELPKVSRDLGLIHTGLGHVAAAIREQHRRAP